MIRSAHKTAGLASLLCIAAAWSLSAQELEPRHATPSASAAEDPVVSQLVAERTNLMARYQEMRIKFNALTAQVEATTGEEQLVLLGQIGTMEVEILDLYDAVADNAEASREAGLDTSELDGFIAREFASATDYLVELTEGTQAQVLELAKLREQLPREQRLDYEQRLADHNARVDEYYEMLLEHAERLDRVGLEGDTARDYVGEQLPVRADRLGGRVALARDQIDDLRARNQQRGGDAATELELRAAELKLDWTSASLSEAARLLDTIDVPTAEYRRLLIRTTGALTEDIFDVEVASGLVDEARKGAADWLKENGPTAAFRLLLFVLILGAARAIGILTERVVRRGLRASGLRTSTILQDLLATLAGRLILLLGLLFGLSQLGVEIGPVLAGIGIIGFAVGFALQDTLSNFAAGAMLLVYRPFDAGDVIETGSVLGTVDHLSLVNTTLLTFDNRKIVVPNNKIWGDVITNITAMEIRRVDLTIGVAHNERVARVEALLSEVVKAHPKVLSDPEAAVKVHKLDETSVDFIVRPWVRRDDYWEVYWDLNRAIKVRFEEEGVELARSRRHVVLESDRTDP